jgi:hypothetical protein
LLSNPAIFLSIGQMHRVGAGGKLFLPQSVVYNKPVPKIN